MLSNLVVLVLAFCMPHLTVLDKRISGLHERLTWTNLTETERYNTSWELARVMYARYRALNGQVW